MKKSFLALAMIFLVLGCTQNSAETEARSNDGMEILNFYSSLYTLFPEETTNLDMVFQNVGDKDATGLKAILFGLSSISAREETASMHTLRKDDSDSFSWVLTAPTLHGFSTEVPFTINSALYYQYSTDSWADIGVVPGGSSYMPVMPSGATDGPILINISSTPSPIRTYKQQDKSPFNLKIKITNVGSGGLAYTGNDDNEIPEKSNMIETLEIVFPSRFTYVCQKNCEGLEPEEEIEQCYERCGVEDADDSSITFDFDSHQNELRLIGNSKTIYIPFMVDETQEPYTERLFVFANYGYKISSSPITIQIHSVD